MCIVTALLGFCSATAQRIFAIKIRRIKTQTAVSQDYLLAGVPHGTLFVYKKRSPFRTSSLGRGDATRESAKRLK